MKKAQRAGQADREDGWIKLANSSVIRTEAMATTAVLFGLTLVNTISVKAFRDAVQDGYYKSATATKLFQRPLFRSSARSMHYP